ncbi:MAG: anti-sigma factor [Gammaproteobacteria bacterium]|nr:anti-sigma factor [Gammaproteobacteria bacterium]
MNAPISEEDLHAYADKRLDADRLVQVEAWLAAHPQHKAEIEAWRTQNERLHHAFDPVLDAPIPARLLHKANRGNWPALGKVASMSWLLLGGLIGYLLHGERETVIFPPDAVTSLPRYAAIAHAVYTPEVHHPVEVTAKEEAHLVGWLSKRLGEKLNPPSLAENGYQLIGGRLLPGDEGEVAQFMYENELSNRLTLYIQPNAQHEMTSHFRYANEKGIDVFYWVDGHFGYALSGNTGREDMLQLARLVYHQYEQ